MPNLEREGFGQMASPMEAGASSRRIAPRWKPRDYFNNTKRDVCRWLVQCRTRHALIGEYYAKFVPTEDKQCPCGNRFQSREHNLISCKQYADHRDILWEVFENTKLDEILGTEEGIEGLAKFLELTGAFRKTG
ncbi:hypothetical protein BT96DRAFT_864924, partial [Gymnopus androsaceus JB14]